MTLLSEAANISPAEAIARRAESKAEVIALLKNVPRPFAIGIYGQLRKAHPEIPAKHLQFALNHITRSKRYLKATIEADCRTALNGEESPLLKKHKQLARDRLAERFVAPSKGEKPVIAPPCEQAHDADKPAQPVAPKQPTRFGKTLSLEKRVAT